MLGSQREQFRITIIMKGTIYKVIKITGTSSKSMEDAVAGAIKRANNK